MNAKIYFIALFCRGFRQVAALFIKHPNPDDVYYSPPGLLMKATGTTAGKKRREIIYCRWQPYRMTIRDYRWRILWWLWLQLPLQSLQLQLLQFAAATTMAIITILTVRGNPCIIPLHRSGRRKHHAENGKPERLQELHAAVVNNDPKPAAAVLWIMVRKGRSNNNNGESRFGRVVRIFSPSSRNSNSSSGSNNNTRTHLLFRRQFWQFPLPVHQAAVKSSGSVSRPGG